MSLSDGKLLHAWPEIPTGTQVGSIMRTLPPVLALDRAGQRFAALVEDEIIVISLGETAR